MSISFSSVWVPGEMVTTAPPLTPLLLSVLTPDAIPGVKGPSLLELNLFGLMVIRNEGIS